MGPTGWSANGTGVENSERSEYKTVRVYEKSWPLVKSSLRLALILSKEAGGGGGGVALWTHSALHCQTFLLQASNDDDIFDGDDDNDDE